MASTFYVTIEASKQGAITVQEPAPHHWQEGKIRGLDFAYEAEVTASAGQIGGQIHRGPVRLTKAWDSATPQLLQAFSENEVLTTVLFEFFEQSASGAESLHHTIELDEAVIAHLHWYVVGGQSAHPAGGTTPGTPVPAPTRGHGPNELEDVTFSFKTMHVEHEQAHTAAADSWVFSHA